MKNSQDISVSFTAPILMVWLIAILIILIAISGIMGARKKNNCLLTCFNVGNCICFTLFFTLVIIVSVASSIFNFADQAGCVSTADDAFYSSANKIFCQEPCPCYYTNDITPTTKNYVTSYDKTNNKLPIRYQQCSQAKDTSLADNLKMFEETYDCAGWCKGYPIKVFSNVNSKVGENQPCYQAIIDYMKSILTTANVFFIIITILFGAFMILTCCLCCHPENSDRSDYTKIYN